MSNPLLPDDLLEQRLRAALNAKASSVGPLDLRPSELPSGRSWRSLPVRRAALGLFGLAAAVACVLLVLGTRHDATTPVGPTHTPSVSRPATPSISPAPSTPEAAPSEAAGLSGPQQGPASVVPGGTPGTVGSATVPPASPGQQSSPSAAGAPPLTP